MSQLCETASGPKIFALLAFHNEMRYLPGYFANVLPQVDGILALDDGSTDGSKSFVARQQKILALLSNPPSHPHRWDEHRNQNLLIEEAGRQKADWLVVVDADERLEKDFRNRAVQIIKNGERMGLQSYKLPYLEVWDNPHTYRWDGIWKNRMRARLFKWRKDHQYDTRRLHPHWAPLNSPLGFADLRIYHLKMMAPSDRSKRREFWEAQDPTREFQAIGYSYFTDESSLELRTISENRAYW